jgi:hypothetical protein
MTDEKRIEEIKIRIGEIQEQKNILVSSRKYEDAARLRDEENKLNEQLEIIEISKMTGRIVKDMVTKDAPKAGEIHMPDSSYMSIFEILAAAISWKLVVGDILEQPIVQRHIVKAVIKKMDAQEMFIFQVGDIVNVVHTLVQDKAWMKELRAEISRGCR